MGNILAGALTGVFIYATDMILRQFVFGGGIMEIIKFMMQGILTVMFVNEVMKFTSSTAPGS